MLRLCIRIPQTRRSAVDVPRGARTEWRVGARLSWETHVGRNRTSRRGVDRREVVCPCHRKADGAKSMWRLRVADAGLGRSILHQTLSSKQLAAPASWISVLSSGILPRHRWSSPS